MRWVSLFLLLAVSIQAAPKKQRSWQNGTVVQITQQTTQRKDPIFGGQEDIELWTFKVMVGAGFYTVQQLTRPNKSPITNTEGATIQYVIDRNDFIVRLVRDREFRMRIIKVSKN